jgi:hypothetical protein
MLFKVLFVIAELVKAPQVAVVVAVINLGVFEPGVGQLVAL